MAHDRDEPLYEYLDRRERELTHQISALRGQIEPKELELAHIKSAKRTLGNLGDADKARFGFPQKPVTRLGTVSADDHRTYLIGEQLPPANVPMPSYEGMTIKGLVVQALLDHFPNGGTAAQLRDFMRDAYQRVIEPSSLRPQMRRLKADEVLEHDPSTDIWNLNKAKRRLYTMYDHPTSRKAMTELKDDAPTDD